MLPHPPPAGAGRRPVLGDAAGTYRAQRRARAPRVRPLGWWLLLVATVLSLTVAAAVVAWSEQRSFAAFFLVATFLPQVVVAVARRRSTTTLQEDGVVVYDGLLRPRTHRWEDVSTVVVEGRYAERSLLRLRDWNEVPLAHVPVEVAQQLRDQLDPSSSRPPRRRVASDPTPGGAPDPAGGPRPPVDLDLEGPFRRGPRRPGPSTGATDATRGTP